VTDSDAAQIKMLLTRLADEGGAFEPPPIETLHEVSPLTTRGRRRTALLAGAAAASIIALAVILTITRGGQHRGTASAQHPGKPTAFPTSYPVVPGKVALYLELPRTTAPADGDPIAAVVHLVNGLGHPFVVPGACNGLVQVGLAVDGQPFGFFDGQVACAGQSIHTGDTRIPVVISTEYRQCSQNRSGATAASPYCQGPNHNQLSPLPPGLYPIDIATNSGFPQTTTPRQSTLRLTPS
jgi:hypothetical protein